MWRVSRGSPADRRAEARARPAYPPACAVLHPPAAEARATRARAAGCAFLHDAGGRRGRGGRDLGARDLGRDLGGESPGRRKPWEGRDLVIVQNLPVDGWDRERGTAACGRCWNLPRSVPSGSSGGLCRWGRPTRAGAATVTLRSGRSAVSRRRAGGATVHTARQPGSVERLREISVSQLLISRKRNVGERFLALSMAGAEGQRSAARVSSWRANAGATGTRTLGRPALQRGAHWRSNAGPTGVPRQLAMGAISR